MKAVSNFRTRIKGSSSNNDSGSASSSRHGTLAIGRSRASTSANPDTYALVSPSLTGAPSMKRVWTVVPRKLRGLHPSPTIIYVRENPELVTQAMDKLYGTLVSTYGVDSKDIRVTDVPTAFDLPSAVRKMGKDRHVIVVVALLTRDKLWFDADQVSRVRDYLLSWSQENAIPLIDGILVDDNPISLEDRICLPEWNIRASKDISTMNFPLNIAESADKCAYTDNEDIAAIRANDAAAHLDTRAASTTVVQEGTGAAEEHKGSGAAVPKGRPSTSSDSNTSSKSAIAAAGAAEAAVVCDYMFGHYLAHRAMEMFYFEHRGW
ncbi:hypothetical protein GQ54DRAFT_296593 [Martensiomyces pterosporus]|nr:hypothetical protein GQ54DRAFT_296593 [Martensiomyces pterosporus]